MILLDRYGKDIVESLHNNPQEWDSLVINKRKPHTYRMWRYFDDYRVCLHKFMKCKEDEVFGHPHPWPAEMYMLCGVYYHTIGYSVDLESDPTYFYKERLQEGSSYKIDDPHVWHKVRPVTTCWTIMFNGPEFKKQHAACRRTKGKDLQKMTYEEVKEHVNYFLDFIWDSYYVS